VVTQGEVKSSRGEQHCCSSGDQSGVGEDVESPPCDEHHRSRDDEDAEAVGDADEGSEPVTRE